MPIESLSAAQRQAWKDRVLPPVESVGEGLWAIPVPIPDNPLVYTYCYAIAGDDGVTVIDPGWDGPEQFEALTAGLGQAGFTVQDIRGVAVSHYHRDHVGLVPWILDKQPDIWLAMHSHDLKTMEGFSTGKVNFRTGTRSGVDICREYGVPDDRHEEIAPARHRRPRPAGVGAQGERLPGGAGTSGAGSADREHSDQDTERRAVFAGVPMPANLIVLGEEDDLPVAGRQVTSLWTPGHTYGHSAFRIADAGNTEGRSGTTAAFVSGDHVLPTISPNIGLDAPRITRSLGDYLSSLDRMEDLDGDVTVLPAHGFRFAGLHDRTTELKEHHEERLQAIRERWDAAEDASQRTVYSVAQGLEWARGFEGLKNFNLFAALAETAAHMHYLDLPVGPAEESAA
ncbi:MBL fold metallo-hydrolase [Brevibacterium litoralis]|uniref:MBL fold metallo-hydrolase n=1 Tax=Brevibacterium litoralis TaxID=3138935 RepID=UPI0032EF3F83